MSKRKYTRIKEVETQIIAMREAGMTRQEIADELGLEKVQMKAWVTRMTMQWQKVSSPFTFNSRFLVSVLWSKYRHNKCYGIQYIPT